MKLEKINIVELYNMRNYLKEAQKRANEGKSLLSRPWEGYKDEKDIPNVQRVRNEMVEMYHLELLNRCYHGYPEALFMSLCREFPVANKFSSYQEIIAAIKGGYAPVKTYTIEDLERMKKEGYR